MIKIALTTDSHYGHSKNTHKIHEKFLKRLNLAIKADDVKVLIHTGDWISYKQDQLERTLKMFRKYIDIPIVCVRGNHDLWQYDKRNDGRKLTLMELDEQHNKWFKENDIHHLENGPFIVDDVIIVGFDGWYNMCYPPTNDAEHMKSNVEGVPTMVYLSGKTYSKLDNLLQIDLSCYRSSVMVTHHPPFTEDVQYLDYCANPNYFQPIKDKFDAFCTGHSHHYWNESQDNCLILNAGSDYDKPRYTIFEV